jgi:hypothetical protein
MAGVGRPPDQTRPSSEPSFIASTVWVRSRRWALTSPGLSPAVSISRLAITSVPDWGEPVEMVLPLKSSTESMPESVLTTTWVKLE